jgi:glycogen operon protein
VIALRREHPVFRRASFLSGKSGDSGLPDAWWFRPDGRRMTQRDWTSPETRTLGFFLNGREIHERTAQGEPVFGDSFLLVFNAHSEPVVFTLPARRFGARWEVTLATGEAPEGPLGARALVAVQEHSLVLLRRI